MDFYPPQGGNGGGAPQIWEIQVVAGQLIIPDAHGSSVVVPVGDRSLIDVQNCATLSCSSAATTLTVETDAPVVEISSNAALTLICSALTALSDDVISPDIPSLILQSVPALTSLEMGFNALESLTAPSGGAPALSTVSIVELGNNGVLETISLPGCALTQASVDSIITYCVADGATGGTLNLTGGTSAAPSAASAVNLATLASRGWTVSTN